jgi:tetratricopeptide (TPR) repeat protein
MATNSAAVAHKVTLYMAVALNLSYNNTIKRLRPHRDRTERYEQCGNLRPARYNPQHNLPAVWRPCLDNRSLLPCLEGVAAAFKPAKLSLFAIPQATRGVVLYHSVAEFAAKMPCASVKCALIRLPCFRPSESPQMQRIGRPTECSVSNRCNVIKPKLRGRFAAVLILSTPAYLGSPAALGQWSPSATMNLGMGMGNIALGQSILSGTRRLGSQLSAPPAHAPPTTPAQIEAALVYKPDPQLSTTIRDDYIKRNSAQDPALRPVLEKAFANNAVLQEFENLLAAHGYSSRNVADAMAALMWTSWQIVNGTTLTEAQIRGVHQQFRGAFMETPALRTLTNPVRQTFAESLAYFVVIEMAYQTKAQRSGDPADLAGMRQTAIKSVKDWTDVDLSQLEITSNNGFRPKPASTIAAPATAALDTVHLGQEAIELAECLKPESKDFNRRINACTRVITNNFVITNNPGNKALLAQVYLSRAQAYQKLNQFDRMAADGDELVRIDPQNPVYYLIRGYALRAQHSYDRAVADFDNVILLQPNIAEVYAERSFTYLQMGDFARAVADSNQAISLKPGMAAGYAVRAAYYMERGDSRSALSDANQAIAVEPESGVGYEVRAEYYLRINQLTKAQSDADRALGIDPQRYPAHDIRGRIALLQDKIDLAIGELTQAIDLGGQQPVTTVSRGNAYERSGRTDLAIADYRRALQLSPTDKVDREAQETARQRMTVLDSAAVNAPVGGLNPITPAASPTIPSPSRRIALVIGMSAYANVPRLRNPVSDARAVADVFRRLGFAEVVEREDLTRDRLEEALKDFGDRAADADWAVIYYAGHGVEMNGVNYLVPVDAKLARAEHVEDEAVTLTRVLSKAEEAHQLRMVILDACRNNPFRMASNGRSRSIGRGLSPVEPARGVLVAYAARDGTTADDGDSGHSPFTQALLTHLETPGVDIRMMFSKVRDQVLARTNNAQEPFTYGSLPGQEFYFKQAVR